MCDECDGDDEEGDEEKPAAAAVPAAAENGTAKANGNGAAKEANGSPPGGPDQGTSDPKGEEGSSSDPADAKRLAAIDSASSVASDLDERWQNGLRSLVAGEASTRFAEHLTMLASVAQLHKNHVEAAYLFRLVLDEYERLDKEKQAATPNGTNGHAANGNGHAANGNGSHATNGHHSENGEAEGEGGEEGAATGALGGVEKAELLNSLGESLLEVKHYSAAQPIFALARKALEEAPDVEDSSVASVEANEARLLSERKARWRRRPRSSNAREGDRQWSVGGLEPRADGWGHEQPS